MSRRRANMLANQIKDQFVNAPPQIRIDFLRKNDEAFESESKEIIQSLMSFQQELGQLTSVFDSNINNFNASGKHVETTQESDSGFQYLGLLLKGLHNSFLTTKVVNPEISQKVQAAESVALAKYMEQLQLQDQIAQNNAAMKTYARPATSSAKTSGVNRTPLSAGTRKRYAASGDDSSNFSINDEADAEIAGELKEIQEEIMGRLNNQDRLIESGRERLKQRLEERRKAAKAAKEDAERNQAQAILSRQEEFENHVGKTKMDMQRKLMTRVEEKMHDRGESTPMQ
ncbi:hypothetical protein Aperf_G00000115361 [Anoplocephala perfoliata]